MSGAKVRAESRADSRAATLVLVGGSRIADEAVGGEALAEGQMLKNPHREDIFHFQDIPKIWTAGSQLGEGDAEFSRQI